MGRDRRDPCHSPTIYADIALNAGASIPIDAEADERAVMLVEGVAELDGQPLEPFALYMLTPGTRRAAGQRRADARAMLLGGGAFATQRHVFWNFVSSSRDRHRPGQGGLDERALPADPRRFDEEYIPYPASPQDGQLSVTEFRRVALRDRRDAQRRAGRRPQAAPPVILLHGFPESHRTWRGVAPLLEGRFRLVMPDQRGFGGSDRPQEVEAYAADKLVDDIFALADALGIERFALVGHDWGGAIAWGGGACAAIRESSGWRSSTRRIR